MMTPPFTYQQSNFMPPPKASFTLQNPQKPTRPTTEQHPIFNNNPLQPIPLKESAILVAGVSGLVGMYKGYSNLTKGKNPVKPLKALALSPLGALWRICDWGLAAISLIQIWNYLLERKRKQALGIPTSFVADAKESLQLAWQGIKSMVSPGSSSQ